mgnify:CR=1 FL=1
MPLTAKSPAALACETLVVRGGNSDYLQPEMVEDMQRLNPRIRSAAVPEAGHYIHDDQPDVVKDLVSSFLAEPAGSRA